MESGNKKIVVIGSVIFLMIVLVVGSVLWFLSDTSSNISVRDSGDSGEVPFSFIDEIEDVETDNTQDDFFNSQVVETDGDVDSFENINTQNNPSVNEGGADARNVETTSRDISGISNAVKIFPKAAAGLNLLDSKVRLVERSSGNIYEIKLGNKESIHTPKRITNASILRVRNAIVSGEGAVVQYEDIQTDELRTLFTTIGVETGGFSKLTRGTLLQSAPFIGWSSKNKKVFYINQNESGVEGFVTNTGGRSPAKVFESSFLSWRPIVAEDGAIGVLTAPSRFTKGFLYKVENSGNLSLVTGDVDGLSIANPKSFDKFVISFISNGLLRISLVDNKSKRVVLFSFQTLAEKCAMGNKIIVCGVPKDLDGDGFIASDLPDSWYRGEGVFEDSILFINMENGEIFKTIDPTREAGEEVDFYRAIVTDDDKKVVFINKRDESVWVAFN
ncbi:MAG: hypothetical protein OXU73_00410 [Candidatus Campbellbacteria bacterium]|nr:hypothetical protein [Candidatus Campbellbacteria bacterium]